MSLLWLALLIQILFYIVNDVHFVIVGFIILSLGLRKFSKNESIYLLFPMVSSHMLYLMYYQDKERFKVKFNNNKEKKQEEEIKQQEKEIKQQAKEIKQQEKEIKETSAVLDLKTTQLKDINDLTTKT